MTLHGPRSPRTFLAAAALACAFVLAGCSRETPETLIASGKAFAAKRDPKAAIIQYKAALQADGSSAEARFLLGQALLDSGDPNSAIVELTKALELKHPPERVVPVLAQALLLAGDLRKLITDYDNTALAEPRAMASLKSSLAIAWSGLGNKAKSEAARAAALAAVPDFGLALVLNATAQASARDFDGALAKVEAVLQREPGLAEGWQLKGEILGGAKGDKAGATAAFKRALAANPIYLPAYGSLISQALTDNDIPAARALAEAMRPLLPPTHGQMMFVDALLALRDNDAKKARDLSAALLRSFPEHLGILQLAGVVEGRAGSLLAAETHFAKVLQFDPDQVQARRNLGQIYLLQGAPTKTLETLRPIVGPASRDAAALALAGEALQRLGDARAAEGMFNRAAALDPTDESAKTSAMLARLGRSDTDAAIGELTVLSQSSKGVYADMAIVSARIQRREYDAALKAIEGMLRKEPDNIAALDLRGRVHFLRNDLPAARQAYEAALKISPGFFSATASLAAIDEREGKPRDAQKRFEAAIVADPRNHLAALALVDLRRREGAAPEELRKILQEAIKNSPVEALPRLTLIDLLVRRKQFTEALAVAQEAAAALPGNLAVLDALGVALTQSGDLQQAMSTFKQSANLDPRAVLPHLRMAELFRNRGDLKSADAALRRALESDPALESTYGSLIETAVADKRPKDVLAVARDLNKRFPQKAYGYTLEGLLALRQKDNDAAVAAFRAALKVEPTNTGAAVRLHKTLAASGKRAEAQAFAAARLKEYPADELFEYQVAEEALGRGDFADAEQRLLAMVGRYPRQVLVLNNLAAAMVALGKPGAVPYAERAVSEKPGNAALLDTLASALAAENQVPRALEVQKRAVAAAPDDDSLRLNLARIALKAQDKTLAKAELDKLAARGRQFPQQGEVARLMKLL
jgi:putative PEP-CTERM system TPR-repeat lipoprotein